MRRFRGRRRLPGEVAGDDEALDLVRSLEDLHHLGFATRQTPTRLTCADQKEPRPRRRGERYRVCLRTLGLPAVSVRPFPHVTAVTVRIVVIVPGSPGPVVASWDANSPPRRVAHALAHSGRRALLEIPPRGSASMRRGISRCCGLSPLPCNSPWCRRSFPRPRALRMNRDRKSVV